MDAREQDGPTAGDALEPDTKDWTWVLGRACPECGLDVGAVPREELGERLRANADAWGPVLERGDARERPDATTWSALEYGCHVRDVFALFGERLTLMLSEDDPLFGNWDQDATAVASRYAEQDPAAVAADTVAFGHALAARFDALDEAAWQRAGRRSDGASFTVESFGRYLLHDPVHHLHDVGGTAGGAGGVLP
ncbi:DinB family protein [Aquipuribacter hungaricus]|uniref:DinB family protein n=1 Tax=Aquipuribacter hungaricus TaxID=545624 RepID=A0ABV7WLL9_9MICO